MDEAVKEVAPEDAGLVAGGGLFGRADTVGASLSE